MGQIHNHLSVGSNTRLVCNSEQLTHCYTMERNETSWRSTHTHTHTYSSFASSVIVISNSSKYEADLYVYYTFIIRYQPRQWMINSVHFLLRIRPFSEIVYDEFSFTHIPTYAELQWAVGWKRRAAASEDLGSVNISGI